MDFVSLEKLFTDMAGLILDNATEISLDYPQDKIPECNADGNKIFMRIMEQESDYSKQLDISYISTEETIIKHSSRTRVWEVLFAAYGPQAHQNVTQIKDGVFRQDTKKLLSTSGVFLVPDGKPCLRNTDPKVVGNMSRWDIALSFNELYILPDEDVGRIEQVEISTKYNK